MARYTIRPLQRSDFETLMALEEGIFGALGEKVLGPYYVRLCCDFFADTCFLAFADERPVGYLLSFLKDREAYCTTLGIAPEFQGTRVTLRLLMAFTRTIVDRVDVCWFTVDEGNQAARALHRVLGAQEVEVRDDFYGKGQPRIVSRIDRDGLERVRGKYERLGLLDGGRLPAAGQSGAAHADA
jgi:ribosomal protein S18 acetylase RimI-like enzyme